MAGIGSATRLRTGQQKSTRVQLTIVAEMPGYPIKKLPFGGPDTRTKAGLLIALHPHHHGHAAVERDALGGCCGVYRTSKSQNKLTPA